MSKQDYFSHPTSTIDPGAEVGSGSKIWHYCHVMPSARIGEGCILGQNCFIGDRVLIGNRVKIQNNVSLYEGVICEAEVFIGPSAVFTNVINPRSDIERKDEFRPTVLKRGCTIGANATVVCGHTVGEYAMVGAGAVVTKDVPAYALWVGNPARQMGWVSQSGYRLHFSAAGEAWDAIEQRAYRLIADQVSPVLAEAEHSQC